MRADECRIVVRTKNGVYEKHVEHAVGSLTKPMSNQQFRQKFDDQVEPVIGADMAKELFSSLADIMNVADVRELVAKTA